MIPILLTTYGAVFAAEILGDKLLYTAGVLSARYRTAPVLLGMAAAFMLKMAAAIAFGRALSHLPALAVAALSAAAFLGVAGVLWFKPQEHEAKEKDRSASKAATVTFAAILFSEWADAGQITAAAMTARFGVPIVVWAGAVAAMVTKGSLVASAGAGARKWMAANISPQAARYVGVGLLLLLGILSVVETLTEGHA